MPDIKQDVIRLRDPATIEKARLASSPYVLRKIIAEDPLVKRLIRAGEKVVPLITEELQKRDTLDDIALAAYTYVLEQVKAKKLDALLGPRFQLSIKKPGPFFVHFAAHAIRAAKHMPVKTPGLTYTREELAETQRMLH